MIFEHTSYRSYLRSVLADRITKNPSHSLRAMAKALGIQPSHLSAVQNGVKNLSLESAAKVATKLGLSREEIDPFCGDAASHPPLSSNTEDAAVIGE